MRLRPRPELLVRPRCRKSLCTATLASIPAFLITPQHAWAQDAGTPAQASQADTETETAEQIAFEANTIEYDSNSELITASGDVILTSGDRFVRSDTITWNRETGQITATGSVRAVDEDGNQLFTDSLELTDELKEGAISNLLLAFRAGGRLAANGGQRDENGNLVFDHVAYSACPVVDGDGCPKQPSWRVTARRVRYDSETKEIRFEGAYFELFGQRILPLPGLAARADGGPRSGFLMPDLGLSASNGLEVSGSYYLRMAENRDLMLSAFVYTETAPMVSAQYRMLTDNGAFQTTGYLTYGSRIPLGSDQPTAEKDIRGYFHSNGKFQLDPNWSVTASVRFALDRTFARRYDITRDDRLRSMVDVERIDNDSYLSISGWATQLLLVQQPQGQVPVALPLMDYRRRFDDPVLGGQFELQANTLALTRTDGQDTRRGFVRGEWNLRRITPWGQEITGTVYLRGDVYHSDENLLTDTVSYRGLSGWQGRAVAIGAVDVKWPFVGEFLGGTQMITPRVQFVAAPGVKNLDIPNEDARSIDLEDSNLFALNRFPGYDRVEDGARVTYGLDWSVEIPNLRAKATIGQSYRLSDKPTLFPNGTGLTEQFSDWVGRTEVRYKDFVKFTHRYRVDKDNFAVRRNEIDATLGSDDTYVELGYLRLNRDIDIDMEDLQDREELRAAGRLAFAKYWSVFGSAVFNLTNSEEDPSFTSDGFEPIRTRLGVAYADDCLEFGVTWRRDYTAIADADKGNSFHLYFALRNLGFR